MTDFVHTLQDQELREALAHYTLSGPLGHLLDAQTENLGQGRLQVFEMSHLMALGQKHLVPILLYLFHRVEQRLEAGTPSLLIVEEAWITALHSLFGAAVESWLRTLRKKNAAVVFVSQSVADVVNSPRHDIILESCPTKILLPNPEAESEHVRRLYEGIGLNRRQIQILATRSEEHTSELQSRQYLVCRLLLEKKNTNKQGGLKHPGVRAGAFAGSRPALGGNGGNVGVCHAVMALEVRPSELVALAAVNLALVT